MGIFSALFSKESVVEKGVDALKSAGDKMFFTEEEKSDWFLAVMKAYEPFKLAQRYLMLIVGIPYVTITVSTILVTLISLLFVFPTIVDGQLQPTPMMFACKWILSVLYENLGWPFLAIVSFYFGGGMLEGSINAFRAKVKK